MDDGYIICEDVEKLKNIVKVFEEKCNKIGIVLNKKKCHIYKLTQQFKFLKVRFFITESGKVVRRINRQATKKERQRLRAFRKFYDMGLMSYRDIFYNFHSWLLSQKKGKSFHLKLNMIRYFNFLFHEFNPYHPPKKTKRKHKELNYISILAIYGRNNQGVKTCQIRGI